MGILSEVNELVKKAEVKPSVRPNYRTSKNKAIYSDKGDWYVSDIGDGSYNPIYLRTTGVPNLAVGTPGRRSISDVRRLVDDIFKSKLVGKDGTIVGVTPNQAIEEIVSHDNMDPSGGPRRGPLSSIAGPVTRRIGEIFTKEEDPTAFTDMRRLPSRSVDGYKAVAKSIPSRMAHKINYLSVAADEKLMSALRRLKKFFGHE